MDYLRDLLGMPNLTIYQFIYYDIVAILIIIGIIFLIKSSRSSSHFFFEHKAKNIKYNNKLILH